jgi:hypothetical protein
MSALKIASEWSRGKIGEVKENHGSARTRLMTQVFPKNDIGNVSIFLSLSQE